MKKFLAAILVVVLLLSMGAVSVFAEGEIEFTFQPPEEFTVKVGTDILLECTAADAESYQWYMLDKTADINDPSTYRAIHVGDLGISGPKTNKLSIPASSVRTMLSGYIFICEITDVDGNKAFGQASKLTVEPNDDPTAEPTEEPTAEPVDDNKSGCGSVIFGGAGMMALVVAGAALVAMKKEND